MILPAKNIEQERASVFPFSQYTGEELAFQGDLMTDSKNTFTSFSYCGWIKKMKLSELLIGISIRTKKKL